MRYYSIAITNDAGTVYQLSPTGIGFDTVSNFSIPFTGGVVTSNLATFSSLSFTGGVNPGALNIEFDMPVYAQHTPQGRQWIRVHGVGLKMISQAADLTGLNITISAGMSPGLPLATAQAKQQGVLIQGVIFQAYGNWQGTQQTLELIINPVADLIAAQGLVGLAFNWQPGQSLVSALTTSLSQAFPTFQPRISVSPNLQPRGPCNGCYPSFSAFAQVLQEYTQSLGGADYPGVSMYIDGNTIVVSDSSATPNTVPLQFQDLIGQPTWLQGAVISFKTVLRADIHISDFVTFPSNLIAPYVLTNTEAAFPGVPARSKSAFQGSFKITEVHHFGNFRQPDADSWSTAFVAASVGAVAQ